MDWNRFLSRQILLRLAVGLFAIALTFIVGFEFWVLPNRDLEAARKLPNGVTAGEVLTLQNAIRTTSAQALGIVGLLVGFFLTWRTIRVSEANVEIARRALELNESSQRATLGATHDRQMTELLAKAVEQLEADQQSTRVAAIYTLEQVALGSSVLRGAVFEILTAYLRDKTPWDSEDSVTDRVLTQDLEAASRYSDGEERRIEASPLHP